MELKYVKLFESFIESKTKKKPSFFALRESTQAEKDLIKEMDYILKIEDPEEAVAEVKKFIKKHPEVEEIEDYQKDFKNALVDKHEKFFTQKK